VFVFGADHIYRMDPSQMLTQHVETGAGVTVAGIRAPISQASQFGVIEKGDTTRIDAFREKPRDPKPLPDDPNSVFASMGNYVFETGYLIDLVEADADDGASKHDIGGNLIPRAVSGGDAHVYDFADNEVPGSSDRDRGYWRDVGSPDAYWEASMDLVDVDPVFNLYNEQWPLRSHYPHLPAAKFVFADQAGERLGIATDSLVAEGSILSGGHIHRTVLHPRVRINSFSYVEESVLMTGVDVGRRAMVRRAIIDKGVHVPAGCRIGYDEEEDRARFTVTDSGLVVVPKGAVIEG
jgi:glucose-1-phosphate adenylyltransferase